MVLDNSGSIPMKNLSGMAGLIFSINKDLQLYSNFSTSFQTPTTSELSNNADGSGGFNTSLKPEQLKNIEIGIRGNNLNHHLFYSLSLYKLIISQMLIPYQIPNSLNDIVFFRNAGKADNNGIDLSLNFFLNNNFNFTLSYSFMDFKYTDFIESMILDGNSQTFQLSGKYVPGIPKNILGLGITHTFRFGLTSGITYHWNNKYFANDWNGPDPNSSGNISDYINDAYSTITLNLKYKLSLNFAQFDLYLGIINLANSKFNGSIISNAAGNRFFEPAAPRNWYSGLTINFN